MSSKRVNILSLVTHRFGWSASQLLAGFEAAASGKAIKVMFTGLAERAQM
jgi:threonine dehydrogenase-like Zn-dependent dehydrogenase